MTTIDQFINDPAHYESEALGGFAAAHSDLVAWQREPSYVTRAHPRDGKVVVVSGGGSGHEPLHIGFVGDGMLDAAVPGHIFSSPTPAQIVEAVKSVVGTAGAVLVVKNYTGDVINFGLAADLLSDDGVPVEIVLVDDDLATDGGDDGEPGRRGTAAAVVVEKVCGAAAERLRSVESVSDLGKEVARRSRSLAVTYSGCTLPGRSEPSFTLPAGQYEFGVGIHGERGTDRRSAATAADLVSQIVEQLADALYLVSGDEVMAIVNNLGSTPTGELYLIYSELEASLRLRGISIARHLVGSYVTAFDMRGVSITLVHASDEILDLWDDPVRTAAISW